VIGDVAGHGFAAAVVMGRLRSALRSYALDHPDPAEVLHRLDRKTIHFEVGAMATALYAVTDPPYSEIRVSCAGHPAPILIAPGHQPVQTDVPPDLPLGVDVTFPRHTTTIQFPAGSSLCLFTDGLVERRAYALDPAEPADLDQLQRGFIQLLRALRLGDADAACDNVLNNVLANDSSEDDIAMLILRRLELDTPR
jgi:phosphoserine phosphatase RsbU/P